jgi:putative transposase
VLEIYVTKTRGRRAALAFLKKALKRFGSPRTIVSDRLRSYHGAHSDLGITGRQDTTRWLNNRGEKSHQRCRRREQSMRRFRSPATLQKFASAHAAIHNHFKLDRLLTLRINFRQSRDAALAEWRQLAT